MTAALSRIIRDIPAAAFELDSRRGDNALDRTSANCAMRHRWVTELLNDLKAVLLVEALVFINRHKHI